MRWLITLFCLVVFPTLGFPRNLNLLGEQKDWQAGIDTGATTMSLSFIQNNLVVDISTDGQREDFPKIRRLFPQPQNWHDFMFLRVKMRVLSDDQGIRAKNIAFVFYDEKTRLPDYPGNPMKQQVIFFTCPVGRWVEKSFYLTDINRTAIRQFDIYLYELPPDAPHKYRWEIARMELRAMTPEEGALIWDGITFNKEQLKGALTRGKARVSTEDGLALTLGGKGEIIEISSGEHLLGKGDPHLPTGILVRDVTKEEEPPIMVGGEIKQLGKAIQQKARLPSLGLEVEAVYKSLGKYIEIQGLIRDTLRRDRAITLYFALPVTEGDWRWWDSVAVSRRAEGPEELFYYERGVAYGLNGSHSKYPLGALAGSKGGLTLAIRMDEPVVHRIAYNPGLHLFYIALDFGLVPERRMDGSPLWEAPFRILLYQHDPEWGFRSALQRYYEFFPQLFTKRLEKEGSWFVWGNMADMKDALEAGFAFHWGPEGKEAVKWDNEHGTIALFYIEPQTYQQSHQDFERMPSLEDVLARLSKLAEGDPDELNKVAKTDYKVYPLAYTNEDILKRIKETASVVLRSLNYGPEGLPYCGISRLPWMGNRWGAILSCNIAPSLPQGKGWFNIQRVILPALEEMERNGAHYDGIALDSFGGYGNAEGVNYRREHFRYSRLPLTFSAEDYKPVQPSFFTSVEWLRELAQMMHKEGKILMANCSWGTTPGWLTFSAPYLDVFGAEAPQFADPDFIRAIAYRKPCTDLPYTPRPEWEVAWHLLHAIFPGHGNDPEVLKRYAGLLKELAKAGWEPITGARANPQPVRLERFEKGERIYFVVHNPTSQDLEANIEFDAKVLQIGDYAISLLPGGQSLETKGNLLTLSLPEHATLVLLLVKKG